MNINPTILDYSQPLLSSAAPAGDVEAPNLNAHGAIVIKGQNGLCGKLQISLDELPIALVRRIESQYPNFSQLSIFEQLEPASHYKVFIRRYIYAWVLCVFGSVALTFGLAAIQANGDGSILLDGLLIFAITLWIGSAIGGFFGFVCCLPQRFNVLVERGMEDTCEYLNNMKGVAFQCKKRKKESEDHRGREYTKESIYIEGKFNVHCPHSQSFLSILLILFDLIMF